MNEPSTRSSLAFVYASYAARYLYLLILIPFYGRVLGPTEYGKVLSAMSLFGVVWLLTNYGFAVVGTRAVASAKDTSTISAEFGRHFKARLLMCAIGIAVGLGGTALSPVLRSDPAFGIIATALGLVSTFNLGWYFQGRGRFRTSVLLEVAGFAISLAMILSLVRTSRDGLLVMIALLVSGTLTTVVSYLIALPALDRSAIKLKGGLSLIRESTAVFAASGIGVVTTNASIFVLSLFATAQHVGFFGAADRIANLGISLMTPANQVLVGTVSRRLAIGSGPDDAFVLMRKSLVAMLAFGLAAMAVSVVFAPWAVPLVMGAEFRPSVVLVQVLGVVFPFAAFNQAARMYVLIPLRHDAAVARVSIIGALITLIAIGFFVTPWGGMGVVIAKIVGEITVTLATIIIMLRDRELRSIFSRGNHGRRQGSGGVDT